ncbi:hypothetical protein MNBD_GAMMA01-191 [hydrothermal vent metagenome]|uniref:Zn-ribbon-containing, possibly nucleic-acid-binding protein n=1 Tax=hydrothermal vent metagenome TaxID=652676 RepID=A0A3B0UYT5_9ZZZZ
MYAFDIIIKNKNFKEDHDQQNEDWYHLSSNYIYFLERNGQIVKGNHQMIINGNTLRIPVICFEKDSLRLKNCSIYNKEQIQKLEQLAGSKITFELRGRDGENPNYSVPQNSSFYILRCGWESPLLCGNTHRPIPLYSIPHTDHGGVDFDNITFWNQDHERLYGLWLSSREYEVFAQDQLQHIHSAINKRGRKICAKIENLTGIPSYYFLFNYRNLSEQDDKNRKCPVCHKKWSIKGKTSTDFIAFKCDNCRLVSELTTNSDQDEEPLKRQ